MWRLVLDVLWRLRGPLAIYVGLEALLWLDLSGTSHTLSASHIFGATLALAGLVPLTTLRVWPAREYAMLPMNSRDRNSAAWIVAVGTPASAVVVAQALACAAAASFGARAPLNPFQIADTAICVVAMCGTIFLAIGLVPLPGRSTRLLSSALSIAAFMVTFVLPWVPLALGAHVPSRVSEISPFGACVLTLGVAAAAGFVRRPWPLWLTANVDAGRAAHTVPARTPRRRRRIEGAWRLTLRGSLRPIGGVALLWALGCLGTVHALSIASLFGPGRLNQSSSLLVGVLMVFFFFLIPPTGSIAADIQPRLTRVLPMTTTVLNAVVLAPAAISWLIMWALLVVGYAIVMRSIPPTLNLPLLVLLIGGSALGIACHSRWKGYVVRAAVFIIAFVVLALCQRAMQWPAFQAAIGILALAAAWWWNGRTLRSSGEYYKRRDFPLAPRGLGAPVRRS